MPNSSKLISNHQLMEFLIIGLGILTRLINLNGSLWLDEAAQAVESARPLARQFDILPDFQPPLFHLILHFWQYIGSEEAWMRLVSLIPGILTIWMVIKIAKKIANDHVAQIAGILISTNQFHLFYSQELRPYSLAAFWAVLAFLSLLNLNQKKWAFPILTLSLAAGLYTTYLFPVFMLTLFGVSIFWYKDKLKLLMLASFFGVLAFIPWLPVFFKQLSIGTQLASSTPLWSQVVSPPLYKMLPLTLVKFLFGRISLDNTLIDFGLIGGLVFIYLNLITPVMKNKVYRMLLFLGAFPIILAFIISFMVPVLDPKRVLYSLPFILILISTGIGKSFKSALVVFGLLLVNLYAVSTYAMEPSEQREPWREAVIEMNQMIEPNDLVVFAFPEPFAPWQWYANPQIDTLAVVPSDEAFKTKMNTSLSNRKKVFLFEYLMDISDPDRLINQAILNSDYSETGFLQYPLIGKIRIYEKVSNYAYAGSR